MKKYLSFLNYVLGATLLMIASTASANASVTSVATANVNLRAGPSTAYPVVVVVPSGAPVITHGCTANYTWCDVSYSSHRGWMSAAYLTTIHQGKTVVLSPVVAPAVGVTVVAYNKAYWDRYYSSYPWYGRWTAYPAGATTVRSGSATGPNGGVATGTAACGPYGCGRAGTVTGPQGGVAGRIGGCGPNGCAGARGVTGPAGNSAGAVGGCGPRGCRGAVVGPNGNVRSGGTRF